MTRGPSAHPICYKGSEIPKARRNNCKYGACESSIDDQIKFHITGLTLTNHASRQTSSVYIAVVGELGKRDVQSG